jgi:transposase-like protein
VPSSTLFFSSDAVFYRVIEEMIEDWCVNVDYSSLDHWVVNYSSYLELAAKKLNVPLPPTKWRMDESHIKGKGGMGKFISSR